MDALRRYSGIASMIMMVIMGCSSIKQPVGSVADGMSIGEIGGRTPFLSASMDKETDFNFVIGQPRERSAESRTAQILKSWGDFLITPPNLLDSHVIYPIDISYRYTYKVRGKHYGVFANAKNFQEVGIASWYGPGFHARLTANGERYNMNAYTAAHKTLPFGTKVKVTNLQNRRFVIVRINDRGPFHRGRIIDLSRAAAKKLGILQKGTGQVHLVVVA